MTKTAFDISSQAPLDNQILVTTPENIAFQYQVVGPFRRLVAYALDLVFASLLFFVFALVLGLLLLFVIIPMASLFGMGTFFIELIGVFQGFMWAGLFAMTWFYGAVMESYWNGQTYGKKVVGLRVLSSDGQSVNGGQAILRNFFRLLDLCPMLPMGLLLGAEFDWIDWVPTCLVGLLAMCATRKYQRIGDLVAGTMVVNVERRWTPELVTFSDGRVAKLAKELPVGFVASATMARCLADFVDQRRRLASARVAEIARHLAEPLKATMGLAPQVNDDLLLCALYYKNFLMTQQKTEPDESWEPSVVSPEYAELDFQLGEKRQS